MFCVITARGISSVVVTFQRKVLRSSSGWLEQIQLATEVIERRK
jgi:hypothetical protein